MRDYSHVQSRTVGEWKKMLDDNGLVSVKEKKRKKRLPYQEWVERTLDSKMEIDKVSEFIINTRDDIKEYFQVEMDDGKIVSFAIDEWMELCKSEQA